MEKYKQVGSDDSVQADPYILNEVKGDIIELKEPDDPLFNPSISGIFTPLDMIC